MSDAFMAIDAGLLAGEKRALVGFQCTRSLLGDVHGLDAVTIAHSNGSFAFTRAHSGMASRPRLQISLKENVEC
jgi:hypothetical protein